MVKAQAVVEIGGPVAEAIEDMYKGLEGAALEGEFFINKTTKMNWGF